MPRYCYAERSLSQLRKAAFFSDAAGVAGPGEKSAAQKWLQTQRRYEPPKVEELTLSLDMRVGIRRRPKPAAPRENPDQPSSAPGSSSDDKKNKKKRRSSNSGSEGAPSGKKQQQQKVRAVGLGANRSNNWIQGSYTTHHVTSTIHI